MELPRSLAQNACPVSADTVPRAAGRARTGAQRRHIRRSRALAQHLQNRVRREPGV